MAKNQFLSPHQKGIVRRYYEHKDTLATQKLSEIVSELFILKAEPDEKKEARLWQSARTALLNLGVHQARVETVILKRDIAALAELVGAKF